jgi:hypothetical protein
MGRVFAPGTTAALPGGMPRLAYAVLIALLALAAAPAARAEPPPAMTLATAIVPPLRAPSWYGRDLLIADGLGLLLVGTCAATIPQGGHPIARRCLVPLVLPGPAVHLSHDRLDRAVLSLGYRLALPLAGGLVGSLIPCKDADGRPCFFGPEFAGALLGAAAAMVIDLAIAYEPSPPPNPGARRRTAGVSPSLAISSGGIGIGLGGWF